MTLLKRLFRCRVIAALFILLSAAGCATRRLPIGAYRLVGTAPNQILIPPGVARADVAERSFDVLAGATACQSASDNVGIRRHHKQLHVTVTEDTLRNRPAGWLIERTAELESQGCIARGTGQDLAARIAEALPLAPNQDVHLLYSDQLELLSRMRIQVVSPILRDPNGPILESMQTSGNDTRITADVRSSGRLLGYEVTLYSVDARDRAAGVRIDPLSADRHISDRTERLPRPAVNYFQFPDDVGFYRVFYEAQQTEYTALVIAASDQAELEQRTSLLEAGPASCAKLDNKMCVAVPRQVAINGLLPITINGTLTWVAWGTTIGAAVRASGEKDMNALQSKLRVYKTYRGKPVAVEFNHSPAIFGLIVTIGDAISWK